MNRHKSKAIVPNTTLPEELQGEFTEDASSVARQPADLSIVLFVSLLVMLNLPILFFTVNTRIDHYSFFAMDWLSAWPLPLALSVVLSSFMAVLGYLCYRWLRSHYSWFTGGRWGPFTRGAILSAIPVALAYSPSIVLTNHTGLGSVISVAGIMACCLCATHAVKDPEMDLDPTLARYWFIVGCATVLTLLGITASGVMWQYRIEQSPPHGNLVGDYEYEWADLGYPREEYEKRYRDALLGFTFAASGFMIVVHGGSVLGATLTRARQGHSTNSSFPSGEPTRTVPPWSFETIGQLEAGPTWVTEVAHRLNATGPSAMATPEYMAVFNGFDFEITASQYRQLAAGKDDLLRDIDLIIDRVAGDVFVRDAGTWTRLDFRVRRRLGGVRSGPFSLLCILARHPGRGFAGAELRALLEPELGDREWFSVSDFIRQLYRRRDQLPVERDERGLFLRDTAKVCLLERWQRPVVNEDRSTEMTEFQ